ncbi:glycosyltransferase family 2 protein [Shewanella oncorhynchi]|uniref:glycosyltransferase family 2 protein n=1 Tax=Shewanella oncorhynchi TaxID=2726434 RepID=UPI0039F00937
MFFSIIVPAYNSELYISRCLDSILAQDFLDYELIVVNDGSIDRTLLIVEEYQNKNEQVVVINQENKGVSAARNEALKISKGKFIVFIDSDDWIQQNYLKFSHAKIINESLDGLVLGYATVNGKVVKNMRNNAFHKNNEIISGVEYGTQFLLGNITNSPCDKIFSRNLWLKGCLFPDKIVVGEDAVAISCVGLLAKRLGLIEHGFLVYMLDTGGVTKTDISKKKLDDICKVVAIISKKYSRFERHLIALMIYRQLLYYVFNSNLNHKISLLFVDAVKDVKISSVIGCKRKIIYLGVAFFVRCNIFYFALKVYKAIHNMRK